MKELEFLVAVLNGLDGNEFLQVYFGNVIELIMDKIEEKTGKKQGLYKVEWDDTPFGINIQEWSEIGNGKK